MIIPLKEKYRSKNRRNITGTTKNVRDPESGTWVWMAERNRPNPGHPGNGRAGSFGARTIQKHGKGKSVAPRRRAYGPWWWELTITS